MASCTRLSSPSAYFSVGFNCNNFTHAEGSLETCLCTYLVVVKVDLRLISNANTCNYSMLYFFCGCCFCYNKMLGHHQFADTPLQERNKAI